LGICVLFFLIQKKRWLKNGPWLMLIILLLTLPHLWLRNAHPLSFLKHNWVLDWSFGHFFKNSFQSIDGNYHYFLPNVIHAFFGAFDPRYCFVGLLFFGGCLWYKKRPKYLGLFLIAFVLYVLFLAGIPYQNTRFLLLVFPIVLILLYGGFEALLERFPNKLFLLGILAIQLILCYFSLKPIVLRNVWEQKMVAEMKPYQNQTLYSFDIDVALQSRGLAFEYQNLWTEKYTSFKANSFVLFNPEKFRNQWKGLHPMVNWENLQQKYHLKQICDFGDGWMLYQLTAK
jgi:hypothetical protein